jgi:hypothetical protein
MSRAGHTGFGSPSLLPLDPVGSDGEDPFDGGDEASPFGLFGEAWSLLEEGSLPLQASDPSDIDEAKPAKLSMRKTLDMAGARQHIACPPEAARIFGDHGA